MDVSALLSLPTDKPLTRPTGSPPLTSNATELVPEINRQSGDVIVIKRNWGTFYGTELDLHLRRRGIQTLLLTGIATIFGVESTARCAFDRGYELIGIGILLAAIIGVAGNEMFNWRWMIGVAVVPSLILTFGMTKLPCSPRWLVEQDRIHDARVGLSKVRDSRETVRRELADMQDVVAQQAGESARGWRALREPWVRPALVAGLGVAAFTQLAGIEMMIYYTPTFLRDAGFGASASLWAALGVALTYLVMTFIGKLVIDHVGRRTLSLATLPVAVASLQVFGAVLRFNLGGHAQQYWVVGCLIAFMIFNSGGIQVIGWLTGAEIYGRFQA